MFPSVEDVRDCFFRAMKSGYSSGGTKTTIRELPGSKLIRYWDGDWLVNDTYFVHPDSIYSSGLTVIHYKVQPVWSMSYQGWYEEGVLPCIKEALAFNYSKGIWYGGRGPAKFVGDELLYRNGVREKDFKLFAGKETIHDVCSGTLLGTHIYQGMLFADCVRR